MTVAGATSASHEYVLTLDCVERPGIVHAVTGFLLEHHGDIHELKQFDDIRGDHFFLRVQFAVSGNRPGPSPEEMRAAFAPLGEEFGMRYELRDAHAKRRVLVMVSKFAHCLNDLLFRARIGELPIEIAAVVSNHPDHRALVEWHTIPFFHIPVTPETKAQAEARLQQLSISTGETVALVVWSGHEAVTVEQVPSARQIKHIVPLGTRYKTVTSASVQVFLAEMAPDQVDLLLRVGWTDLLPGSPIGIDAVLARLAACAERGYAVNFGETAPEEVGIAAPVRDHRGEAVAAVVLAAPFYRVAEDAVPELGAACVQAATQISARLGATPG